jgi:outer membrane immunogenic protein
MKKILLASVAVSALTISHSGNAADLAPASKAPPLPVFSWTGCFAGVQTGWGWARHKVDQTQFNTFTGEVDRSASSGHIDSSGAVFGGQLGCDYQFAGSSWVVGVQGTFLGTDLNRLAQDPHNGVSQTGGPGAITFAGGSIGVRTRSLASVTGRLGWAGWSPQTMVYVRGGGAWTDTQLDMRSSAIFLGGFGFAVPPNAPVFDTKYTGWTVGGGFEWMVAANWSAFIEYNYYDFKSKSILNQVFGPPNIFGSTLDLGLNISTVTVGVNYRFGGGPVYAKY